MPGRRRAVLSAEVRGGDQEMQRAGTGLLLALSWRLCRQPRPAAGVQLSWSRCLFVILLFPFDLLLLLPFTINKSSCLGMFIPRSVSGASSRCLQQGTALALAPTLIRATVPQKWDFWGRSSGSSGGMALAGPQRALQTHHMLCFVPKDVEAFGLCGGHLPPELSVWPAHHFIVATACQEADYGWMIQHYCLKQFQLSMEGIGQRLWCDWDETVG
ncbi:PREDICTED: receptor activity-modifying protein 1 [Pygoscelis adeliae]|uniref:receptor activity-modifying protein 1 n=1 Tax=Pygoscelis adeliae TaxID=9238 RepID=UPI0004F4F779|nr:PREDICTED: receptor activity-modifying protein 1 [Pygoscelis adeliae]